MLALVKHPFAASLAGIHHQYHHKDVVLYLSTASWPGSTVPDMPAVRPSCDTSMYTPSFQGPVVLREDSLSKLEYEAQSQRSNSLHEISQDDIPLLRHKESNLLPSPIILQSPRGQSLVRNKRSRPPLKRNATTDTATSSVYSQPSETSSSFSNYASSMSSLSDNASAWTLGHSPPPPARTLWRKPLVPHIPQKYLSSPITTALCNDKPPARPNSRPHMPPAEFWEHARNVQRTYDAFMEHDPPPATTLTRSRRRMESLHESSLHRKGPTGVQPSSEHRAPKENINRSYTVKLGQVQKYSHESLRKGRSVDISATQTWI